MSRHTAYLNAIFPDAKFIHIVRDPRGTAASLLSWNLWPKIKIVNNRYFTPEDWAAAGHDPIEMAALIWLQHNQIIINAAKSLGERYKRIYYEYLVENPKGILAEILNHCDLDSSLEYEKFIDSFNIRNMNYRFQERLTSEQIATVERIAQPLVDALDYGYSHS